MDAGGYGNADSRNDLLHSSHEDFMLLSLFTGLL